MCGNWGLLMERWVVLEEERRAAQEAIDTNQDLTGIVPNSSFIETAEGRKAYLPIDNVTLDLPASMRQGAFPELRGAQAGGVSTMVANAKGFGKKESGDIQHVIGKAVKPKRGYLGNEIFKTFNRAVDAKDTDYNPKFPILAQGHCRFGTSSVPAVVETHPHQWEPPPRKGVNRFDFNELHSAWKREETPWSVVITHNGDFDGWMPYDQMVQNADIGKWLENCLHVRNGSKGDSAKMAGIMDLITTQGVWWKSLRMAFVMNTMHHIDQVRNFDKDESSPTIVPPCATFEEWGLELDEVFTDYINDGEVLDVQMCDHPEEMEEIINRFVTALKSLPSFEEAVLPAHYELIVHKAIEHFLTQDMYAATRMFFDRAEGTFGCTVTCTAFPSSIVLAAKGQPISVGFSEDGQICTWSSELAALRCCKVHGRNAMRYRFDMQEGQGEMLQISLKNDPNTHDNPDYFCPMKGSTIRIRGEKLNHQPGVAWLDGVQFADRLLDMKYEQIGIGEMVKKNVIQKDLDDISGIVEEIDACWASNTSLNVQSGRNFSNLLLELMASRKIAPVIHEIDPMKAARQGSGMYPVVENSSLDSVASHPAVLDREPSVSRPIDVLVFGVENSLWIGQQFLADLSRMVPNLRMTCVSSNWVVGALQSEAGHVQSANFPLNKDNFKIDKNTICLAVSQSGTTYPTVWATRLLFTHTPNIFCVSGDFDTLLSGAAGQLPNSVKFSQRIFSTLSGVRPAEPSTAATIAMHHTLTWLLVIIAGHMQSQEAGAFIPPKNELKLIARSLAPAARTLTGMDGYGNPIDSHVHKRLKSKGRFFSTYLSECYWSYILIFIYITVTVTAGWPILSQIWDAIVPKDFYGCNNTDEFMPGFDPDSTCTTEQGWKYFILFLDAMFYFLAAFIFLWVVRLITGRRVFARITGKTILIAESTMNYKLLRAYLSKLKALSYRVSSFSVCGQNHLDHFVHEYTHLTYSDVLVFAGRPDGRLASLASSESAAMMSISQAKFISKENKGIEVITLGHNPFNKIKSCTHITLPTHRPESCSEQMLYGKEWDYTINTQSPGEVMSRVAELYQGQAGFCAVSKDVEGGRHIIDETFTDDMIVEPFAAAEIVRKALKKQEDNLKIDVNRLPLENLFEGLKEVPIPVVMAAFRGDRLRAMMNRQRHAERLQRLFFLSTSDALLKQRCFDSWQKVTRNALQDNQFHTENLERVNRGFRIRIEQNIEDVDTINPEMIGPKAYQTTKTTLGRESMLFDQYTTNSRQKTFNTLGSTIADIPHENHPNLKLDRAVGRRSMRFTMKTMPTDFSQTGTPGQWRAAEARRRTLHRKWMAHQLSTLGLTFNAWRRLSNRDSPDERTAKFDPGFIEKTLRREPIDKHNADFEYEGRVNRNPKDAKVKMDATSIHGTSLKGWTCTCRDGNVEFESYLHGVIEKTRSEQTHVIGLESTKRNFANTAGIIKETAVAEHFYETRIASAERLISFMIMFHEMVKPLSKLPFYWFDMDRSQSRLRVASTPCPIPMVEKLPPCKWDMSEPTIEESPAFPTPKMLSVEPSLKESEPTIKPSPEPSNPAYFFASVETRRKRTF